MTVEPSESTPHKPARRRPLRVAFAVLLTVALLPLAAASVLAERQGPDWASVRAATAKYHQVERALADGYIRVSGCEEHAGLGGMGFHYLNPALAGNPAIDPLQPELLLYAPTKNGLRLVAVEYFTVDGDQNTETDGDRPSIFGVPFDGPMVGHAPGMPIHYDLHVWLWRNNPEGLTAQWNPKVSC